MKGQAGTLTGWGATIKGGQPSSKLRQTRLTIFTQQFCNYTRIGDSNLNNSSSAKLPGMYKMCYRSIFLSPILKSRVKNSVTP